MDSNSKKQNYGATGSDWKDYWYAGSNAKEQKNLVDKFNRVMQPAQKVYTQKKPYTSTSSSKTRQPLSPKEYKLYVKVYQEIYKAITESLVKT